MNETVLWTGGESIFFGDKRIILKERSHRLFVCLLKSPENFASKDELKQAGWPEAQVLKEYPIQALREAVRRMKNELKAEFKRNNLGDPPTVKSVRGRGYRLENVKPSDTGGDNGGE